MVIVEKLCKKIGRFLRRFPWLRNIFFVSGVMLNATEGFLGVKKRLSIVEGNTIVGASLEWNSRSTGLLIWTACV